VVCITFMFKMPMRRKSACLESNAVHRELSEHTACHIYRVGPDLFIGMVIVYGYGPYVVPMHILCPTICPIKRAEI
jgi:hypothetical protein